MRALFLTGLFLFRAVLADQGNCELALSVEGLVNPAQQIKASEIDAGTHDTWLSAVFNARDRPSLLMLARDAELRRAVSDWIQRDFSKNKITDELRAKSIALVGAGVHNAIAASVMSAETRDRNRLTAHVVILERGPFALSTFYRKLFHVNSPELQDGRTANPCPGGLIQLADFAPNEASVAANNLAFLYLVNLRASQIPVYLNVKVSGLDFEKSEPTDFRSPIQKSFLASSTTQPELKISMNASIVGFAPGLGDKVTRQFISSNFASNDADIISELRRTRKLTHLERGIYNYSDFLRLVFERSEAHPLEALKPLAALKWRSSALIIAL